MKSLKEGILIPLIDTHISLSGDDEKDNPICDAVVGYLEKANYGERFSVYFCLIDEKVSIYGKGTDKMFGDLYTTTMLQDWLRAYFDGKPVQPFTLKIFHQRDDNDQIEDERLWLGIAEDGDGVCEYDFEKLYGLLTDAHIQEARDNAFLKLQSPVCQDYLEECPVSNVLTEVVAHLPVEVGVDGEQAEFYIDDPQTDIIIPLTLELQNWLIRFEKGEQVQAGVIYINRDDTLPEQPLFVGIDHDIAKYNVVDFERLSGMSRRVTRGHIDASLCGNAEHCAVATVLSEMFPHYEINVNGEEALIHTRGTEHAALLISERLGHWIDAYDNENDVGTFTLVIKNLEGNEYYKYLLDIKDLTTREKDLQKRISRLSELSAEMELHHQKLTDHPEEHGSLLREYEDLFAETVHVFGN